MNLRERSAGAIKPAAALAGGLAAVALVLAVVAASTLLPQPSPGPSDAAVASPGATSEPTASPTPAPTPFPLAIVTGMTNPKPTMSVAELVSLASAGRLVLPCGVTVTAPDALVAALAAAPGASASSAPAAASGGPAGCRAADTIDAAIVADPSMVALLPPGLVVPTTRALPITGSGAFGAGGPDLFGAKDARSQPWPITAIGEGLPAAWRHYDASEVWTLVSLGDTCPDRGPAIAAIRDGLGWDWVMGGGTAHITKRYVNNTPPPGVLPGHTVVSAVDTGNAGAVPALSKGADLTIDDFECPIVDTWTPNYGTKLVFSVAPEIPPLMVSILGVDVAYLANNHQSDMGSRGVRTTLAHLDAAGIARTGLGMDIDEAMRPAVVTVNGKKIAFVAFNEVGGPVAAAPGVAGVLWLTKANVDAAVARARREGADMVICAPQWWGGTEYHGDLRGQQKTDLKWFDAAGCDQVIGAGTHWAGPILLRTLNGRPNLVMASQGNYLFGQAWDENVQEGVILEAAFRGTELVTVKLHPYVMLRQAQASLIDPESDASVLFARIYSTSDVSNKVVTVPVESPAPAPSGSAAP